MKEIKREFKKWLKTMVSQKEVKKYGIKAIYLDFLCCKGYKRELRKLGIV